MNRISCWFATNIQQFRCHYFTDNSVYDGCDNCFCPLVGLSPRFVEVSGADICPGVNAGLSVPGRIGSFTYSNPATLTHNDATVYSNHGIALIPAFRRVTQNIATAGSGRLQNRLVTPVTPGSSYKLSYWAKTFDLSGTTDYACLNSGSNAETCFTLCQLDPLNVESRPRFILSNSILYDGEPEYFDDMGIDESEFSEVNTIDLGTLYPDDNVHIFHLATPQAIPPISYPDQASADWHYREMIITIPENAPADLDVLYIDNDIWSSNHQSVITGFFLDDVSLAPYFGDVTEIPAAICPGSVLNDLGSFVGNENYIGTFSCSDCPAGTIGPDNNSFDAGISGTGTFHITFNYSDLNGCSYQDVSVIEVTADACCNLAITVNEVTDAACAEIANGSANITVTNANANTTYSWTGPVTSDVEDPDNLLPGTYIVTVSNGFDCSVSEEIVVSIMAPVVVPTITNQAMVDLYLNDQTLHVSGELTFAANPATYEIENANIFFDNSVGLTVNEGAAIGMLNVTLDACSSFWRGVELKANRNNFVDEASIKLADHVIIRHARIGVNTADAGSGINTPFAMMRCGTMLFRNSSFENNQVAITVKRGHDITNPNLGYGGVEFQNTTFTWTDELFNRFPSYANSVNPKRMINIWAYDNARFIDCDFINSTTSVQWNRRGNAIYGFNARCSVLSSNAGNSTSLVNGFWRGVRLEQPSISTLGSTILDITFEKNQAAIMLNSAMFHNVDRNIIHVGMPTDNAALNAALVKYEGISLRRGTGWEISENDITGYIPHAGKLTDSDLPYSVGISIAQTLSANEEVYRNYMHDLNWAFVANGNNNSDEGLGGLRYVCNENEENNYDFVVADFPGAPGSSQIGEVQIDFGNTVFDDFQASGNKFTQGNSHPYNDFYNESQTPPIEYWFYDGSNIELLAFYNSLVAGVPSSEVNLCASEISMINANNRPDWQDLRETYRSQWLNTRFLWKLLIDDGDTEALRDQVDDSFGTDTWVERQKLLDISPYVSRTVLEAVADNTILFPHPVAMEIFLANPDVLGDRTFIMYLESKAEPMPAYMIEILMSASNQTTVRTILEDEMRDTRAKYLDAAQKLMRSELANMSELEVEHELTKMRSLPSMYLLLDNLLSQGEYAAVDSMYQSAKAFLGLGVNELADFGSYNFWFDWNQRLNEGNISLDSIPLPMLEEMEVLVMNEPFSFSGQKASSLLNFFYDGDFEQTVFVPADDPATKRQMRRRIANTEAVSVYPSPTGSLANIRLNLSDTGYLGGSLNVYGMDGRNVFTNPIMDMKQQWALDVINWPTGVYLVNISAPQRPVLTEKLEIIR